MAAYLGWCTCLPIELALCRFLNEHRKLDTVYAFFRAHGDRCSYHAVVRETYCGAVAATTLPLCDALYPVGGLAEILDFT